MNSFVRATVEAFSATPSVSAMSMPASSIVRSRPDTLPSYRSFILAGVYSCMATAVWSGQTCVCGR